MSALFSSNRHFRTYLLFSAFSGIGGGTFRMFMMWVVHAVYQNAMYTGIAGFMFAAPAVFSFIVGPLADRKNQVTVIRAVAAAEFVVVALAAFMFTAANAYFPGVWFFHLAILIVSTAGIFGDPALTALLPKIVPGEDLAKANAASRIASVYTSMGVAVILYILMSGGAGFALILGVNAVVLLAALVFSVLMRSSVAEGTQEESTAITEKRLRSYFADLKEGMAFAKKNTMTGVSCCLSGVRQHEATSLLPLVTAAVFMGLFASMASVNLPRFAEIHLGTAWGYIILSALAMFGGLAGSYISRVIESQFKVWKIIVWGFVLAGIMRILFVYVIASDFTQAVFVYIVYIGLGGAIGIFYGTLMQKLPPKHLVGRVATTITSLNAVAAAIGTLAGGLAGTLLSNVDTVFIIHGASYMVIGLCLCLSKHVRKLPKIGEVETLE